MTQNLGLGYEFTKKACFVCGSLNHLIRDCNYHENRMVKESVLKNVGKGIGQRNVRPTGKAVVPVSTARPVNTVAPRPTMNGAKTRPNVFHKSHSPVGRPFYQRTSSKTYVLKEKVNTVKVNDVTTAGSKAVVSTVQGNKVNAVKASACWTWRLIRSDYTLKYI
ncbi:hypothetical protein Tco_1222663 [Tanacetum coccineum]